MEEEENHPTERMISVKEVIKREDRGGRRKEKEKRRSKIRMELISNPGAFITTNTR